MDGDWWLLSVQFSVEVSKAELPLGCVRTRVSGWLLPVVCCEYLLSSSSFSATSQEQRRPLSSQLACNLPAGPSPLSLTFSNNERIVRASREGWWEEGEGGGEGRGLGLEEG